MRPYVRARAVLAAVTLLATATGLTANALAQDGATSAPSGGSNGAAAAVAPQGASKLQQLKQFLHLISIAKPDVAASQGQALLDAGLTASELATLVDENDLAEKFDKVASRGRGMAGVDELVQRYEQMLREGRLELARQPARIEESIRQLSGTLRQQMFARERLAAAGEYAVPKLLAVVTSGKDPTLEIAATQVLVSMKRLAVMPLAASLMNLDPISQRKVADMLGEIGYPAAAPFLVELATDAKTPGDVRDAAMRAFHRIGAEAADPSAQFTALARRFFLGDEALVAYPDEPVNNVWTYDSIQGLQLTPVPTQIYREVMAMLLARKALSFDPANRPALAIYVASDLRRENRMAKDMVDPIFGSSAYSPSFFAMATGPSIDQSVIGLAVDRKDTALVRDAIAAIAQTAGRNSLVAGEGRQPLLECLRYPERRVQYEAALAIGGSLPDRTFPGDFSVVPILASAVRDAGMVSGAVVAASEEDRRQLSGRLSTLGFTTMTGAPTFPEFEPQLVSAGGLDMLVVAGSADSIKAAVDAARIAGMSAAVPVVAVVAEGEVARATQAFALDSGVVVWPANGTDDTFKGAVTLAFDRQSGGRIAEDEAMDYTVRSLEALKNIAISNSPVFSIRDAEKPLMDAMDSRQGALRLLVADVVALIPGPGPQRKLIDAALNSADEAEKIELLTRAAASARHFGNQAEPRQIDALRDLIAKSSGPLADAAGRLYGALDLSTAETIKLITAGSARN
ncbi:MAG: HEAT repeat domain-containing protein [Phycisphaerales bacterium]